MKKIIIFILILISFSLIGCQNKTLKIGFAGDLSGVKSQPAIDARNALILSIKLINEDGGINDYDLELVVKDDKSNYETALQIHDEFKSEDVHIVIGHMISSLSRSIKVSADEELLFISPTMSTDSMTNIDDFFIRTSPINSQQAYALDEYFKKNDVDELVVVCDLMNAEYTENLYNMLDGFYSDSDHTIKEVVYYNSLEESILEVAKKVDALEFSNVLFITQATDTAFLQQYLLQNDHKYDAYSVAWSMTEDVVEKGGSAVDGMIFTGLYIPNKNSEAYNDFASQFENAYGYKPSIASVMTYDALMVLIESIKEVDNVTATTIKEAILDIGNFKGLQEEFSINQYGDSDRTFMMYQLIEG